DVCRRLAGRRVECKYVRQRRAGQARHCHHRHCIVSILPHCKLLRDLRATDAAALLARNATGEGQSGNGRRKNPPSGAETGVGSGARGGKAGVTTLHSATTCGTMVRRPPGAECPIAQGDVIHEPDANATLLLLETSRGEGDAASRLAPMVYDNLRRLAADRLGRGDWTCQPTAIVHEAY